MSGWIQEARLTDDALFAAQVRPYRNNPAVALTRFELGSLLKRLKASARDVDCASIFRERCRCDEPKTRAAPRYYLSAHAAHDSVPSSPTATRPSTLYKFATSRASEPAMDFCSERDELMVFWMGKS